MLFALNSVLSDIDVAIPVFFVFALEYIFQYFYFQPFCVILFYICLINGFKSMHFISKLLKFACTLVIHILKYRHSLSKFSVNLISIFLPNKTRNLVCIFLPLLSFCDPLSVLPPQSLLVLISSLIDLLISLFIVPYIPLFVLKLIVFLSAIYLLFISETICY